MQLRFALLKTYHVNQTATTITLNNLMLIEIENIELSCDHIATPKDKATKQLRLPLKIVSILPELLIFSL